VLSDSFSAIYSQKDAHPEKKNAEHNRILMSNCSIGKEYTIAGYVNK